MRQADQITSKWLDRKTGSEKDVQPLKRFKKNSGQVVIEYVLLLVIVTSLGAVIIREFVSRNPDEPGLFVAKWNSILQTIATDNPEE